MLLKLLKKRFKLLKNQRGMTLIELMAVVVILGILATAAGAAVTGGFTASKANSDAASMKIIEEAAQRYYLDKSAVTPYTEPTLALLVSGGYLISSPTPSDNTKTFTVTGTGGSYAVAIQ